MALLALSACAEEGVRLEEDQLARLIARERTFEWLGFGFSGEVTLADNGAMHLRVYGVGEDDGRWQQEGAVLCVQFDKAIGGLRRCAEIARLPDGTYEGRDTGLGTRFGIFYPARKREKK